MRTPADSPGTQEAGTGDSESQASLGYTARPDSKHKHTNTQNGTIERKFLPLMYNSRVLKPQVTRCSHSLLSSQGHQGRDLQPQAPSTCSCQP